MSLVEVVEVAWWATDPSLVRYHLDEPKPGRWLDGTSIEITGWIVASGRAVAAEITLSGSLLRRVPLDVPRRDVATHLQSLGVSDPPERSGFRTRVGIGPAREVHVTVHAVLEDRRRVPIVSIRARRRWRESRADVEPSVSIVVARGDRTLALSDTLQSVVAGAVPAECVVVDSCSLETDDVAAQWPSVRFIRQRVSSVPAAWNAGLQQSLGNHLVFLEAGDRPMSGDLEAALAELFRAPDLAAVVGPRLAVYRRSVFETARRFDTSLGTASERELQLRVAAAFPIAYLADADRAAPAGRRAPRAMRNRLAARDPLWSESFQTNLDCARMTFDRALRQAIWADVRGGRLLAALRKIARWGRGRFRI